MRYFLIPLMLAFFVPQMSHACDICGCGVGSYYIGILPDFKKRFVGIRYQNKSLLSHLGASGTRTYLTTDETFHTIEVWGASNFGKGFRVMYLLPFNTIQRSRQNVQSNKSGIGDAAVFAFYNLFKTEQTNEHANRVVQALWLGGGIKIPLGRYDPADKDQNVQQLNTFQLGTGSVDFSLNAMYDLRIQDAGININTTYKINSANKSDYQYGNKLTAAALAYYKWRLGTRSNISPNAGFVVESASKDISNRTLQYGTGGAIWLASTGFEYSIGKMGLGANFQIPFTQNLGKGIVRSGNRLMTHVSLAF